MHDYGRNPILSCRKGAKFCRHIPNRYHRSAGFQQGNMFIFRILSIEQMLILIILIRCTNYTIHALSCSFIGKTELVCEFLYAKIKKNIATSTL